MTNEKLTQEEIEHWKMSLDEHTTRFTGLASDCKICQSLLKKLEGLTE